MDVNCPWQGVQISAVETNCVLLYLHLLLIAGDVTLGVTQTRETRGGSFRGLRLCCTSTVRL